MTNDAATARSLRSMLTGVGEPGPIEERLGRRLVRLVDPLCDEGAGLLSAGDVELIGPEGTSLGRIPLDAARVRLKERIDRSLDGAAEDEVRAVRAVAGAALGVARRIGDS